MLKGKGTGGRAECLAAIPDNTAVMFGAFKLMAVDNRGSTISSRPKFVLFFYRAENAPSMQKAKAGRHMGAIEQCFHGYHVMFAIDELHEMSEAEIVKKLRACGGAHQPTGYDFGHGDVGEGATEAEPEKAAAANPADAAPLNAKAPKPEEEGKLRAHAYMNPAAAAAKKAADETPAAAAPAATAAVPPATSVADASAGVANLSLASDKPAATSSGRSVVMLVTSMPSTTVIEGNQLTLRNVLRRLAYSVTEVDGMSNTHML